MTVRCQHNAQLDANFEMKIYVDIVVCEERSQRPIAVLDTKYKASELPSEADIYQIAFYARELHVRRALLVYPSMLTRPFRMVHGSDILLVTGFRDRKGTGRGGRRVLGCAEGTLGFAISYRTTFPFDDDHETRPWSVVIQTNLNVNGRSQASVPPSACLWGRIPQELVVKSVRPLRDLSEHTVDGSVGIGRF